MSDIEAGIVALAEEGYRITVEFVDGKVRVAARRDGVTIHGNGRGLGRALHHCERQVDAYERKLQKEGEDIWARAGAAAKNLLKLEEHGPFQAQLVHLGSEPGEGGMGRATFRAKPEELRGLGALLFAWVELKATTAGIVGAGGGEPDEESEGG